MKLSTDADRARWIDFVCLQPLPLEVSCQRWREARSNEQNAYLWGVVYPQLVEATDFTSDDWHEHYCGEYFGWVEHVKPSGVVEYRPKRTTTRNEHGKVDKMSVEDFGKFTAFVESDCAKRGVFLLEEWKP